MRFLYPAPGDGITSGSVLVRLDAPRGARIEINGISAAFSDGAFSARIALRAGKNLLVARDLEAGETASVLVYALPGAHRGYRFTVDDCIRCFEHLAAENCASIFDDPFLKVFQKAWIECGSRVHINAFYENLNGSFNLSQMPDRYRAEFEKNADWLSISFHARREFPDEPYKDASYETVLWDCRETTKEIRRFAGEKVLRDSTTLHWGACGEAGTRALYDAGFRALSAYLCFDERGEPLVSYHLNREQVEHAGKRSFWYDEKTDMLFAKLHLVLNAPELTADRVEDCLNGIAARGEEGDFIQMVIHEQYFYPDYAHYEPDYERRILTMARWMQGRGYQSVSLSEILS